MDTPHILKRQDARANVHSQQPITSDGNVVFNYHCGLKIGNITNGTEVITTGYDVSPITSEPFVKMYTGQSFLNTNEGGLT
jgi:hypothetical protein